MAGKCPYCGHPDEGNAGDYYHEKECERRDVLRRLDAARADGNAAEITRLRRELEAVSYVGD